jgi:uncharacterized spore protein YtfJ
MSLKEVFDSMIERLNGGASVRAIYGEPVEARGKTIIPVAKVMYGFGGGFGETGKEKKDGTDREGGGAGGGVRAKPVGVIEITDEDTRFVPCTDGRKYAVLLVFGFVVGFLIGRR